MNTLELSNKESNKAAQEAAQAALMLIAKLRGVK